jgi:hypothetical protein
MIKNKLSCCRRITVGHFFGYGVVELLVIGLSAAELLVIGNFNCRTFGHRDFSGRTCLGLG